MSAPLHGPKTLQSARDWGTRWAGPWGDGLLVPTRHSVARQIAWAPGTTQAQKEKWVDAFFEAYDAKRTSRPDVPEGNIHGR